MKTRLLTLGVMGALSVTALAGAPAPFVGTWKLNLASSHYTPGPPPRCVVQGLEAVENGHRFVSDSVDAEGKASHREWTVRFDGKDHPITGAEPGRTISVTKIDDYTYTWIIKASGTVDSAGRAVYSRDGKLRTITWGDNRAVYDRQ